MKSFARRVLLLVTALFLVATAALAQSGQGSVEGTVIDSSGAVVPGIAVKLTNTATNLSFTVESNETGYFRFPVIPIGNYDLVAEGKSFAPYMQKGVGVTIGSKINLILTLGVANKQENVEVTGEMPVVETTRSSVSNTVSSRAISELPVNGRNFID